MRACPELCHHHRPPLTKFPHSPVLEGVCGWNEALRWHNLDVFTNYGNRFTPPPRRYSAWLFCALGDIIPSLGTRPGRWHQTDLTSNGSYWLCGLAQVTGSLRTSVSWATEGLGAVRVVRGVGGVGAITPTCIRIKTTWECAWNIHNSYFC